MQRTRGYQSFSMVLCLFLLCILASFQAIHAQGAGTPGTLKWCCELADHNFANPAVAADGTIYINTDDRLYAVHPANGTIKWVFNLYQGVHFTPAIGLDGTVYICANNEQNTGVFYAIDPHDAGIKWTVQLNERVGVVIVAIGADGTIYLGADTYIYALNPLSGSVKWTFELVGTYIGVDCLAIGTDGNIYTGTPNNMLFALDPVDGSEVWSINVPFLFARHIAIAADGTIYAPSGSAFRALDPADGSQIWISEGYRPVIAADGTIYVTIDNDTFCALDPADGSILWESTGKRGSAAVGDDGVIYLAEYERLYALNPADGSIIWTYETTPKGDSLCSPAIGADGTVYVQGYAGLSAIYTSSQGLANSSWPMFRQGPRHTGCAQPVTLNPPDLVFPAGGVPYPTDILLQWRDGNYSPQETGHRLRIKPQGGVYSYFTLGRDSTELVIYGLTEGTTFLWNAQALGDGLHTFDSPWAHLQDWQFTTSDGGACVLNPPVMLSPAHNAIGQSVRMSLQWQDSNSNPQEYGYRLRIRPAGGEYTYYAMSRDTTQRIVSKLMFNTTYFWNVQALGDGADTLDSPWANGGDDRRFATMAGMSSSGRLKWIFEPGCAVYSSPALAADGTVYVSADNTLYALRPADGSVKWARATGANVSPAVALDGTIYSNGYAIHPADGSVKWQCGNSMDSDHSPAVSADGAIYWSGDELWAIAPEDGSVKWTFASGIAFGPATIGPDGTIYVFEQWPGDTLYALNPADGSVKWEKAIAILMCHLSVAADGIIYLAVQPHGGSCYDFQLHALDPVDGSILWTSYGDGNASSDPLLSADMIYLGTNTFGYLSAFNRGNGRLQWLSPTILPTGSTPAMGADGTLYIAGAYGAKTGDYSALYAVHSFDGSVRWDFRTADKITSSPVIAPDGTIYFSCYDGKVYALSTDSPGLATTDWPMFNHDARHSGSAQPIPLLPPRLTIPIDGADNQPIDVILRWQESNYAPQETGYRVRIRSQGGSYSYFDLPADSVCKMVAQQLNDTTYYWNVKALGNGQTTFDSPWANDEQDWSYTTYDGFELQLNPPVLLAPADQTCGHPRTVTLQWQDTNVAPQERTYRVRVRKGTGSYTLYDLTPNTTELTISGLHINSLYEWNVRSLGNGGDLQHSDWANLGQNWQFQTRDMVQPPLKQ